MADTVNPQITDAVAMTSSPGITDAPALALANLYQASAQALATAAQNAVSSQQQVNEVLGAATTQALALLFATQS